MNILLMVDQNHSFKQALRVAYDKAQREGGVDELTETTCQLYFSCPEPEEIYHEKIMDFVEYTDDGVGYNEWSPYLLYEQVKIDARKGYADFLRESLQSAGEDLKKDPLISGMSASNKGLHFMVDEKGMLKCTAPGGKLSPDEDALWVRLLNDNEKLKTLAVEYARVMLSLLSCTKAGLNAGYAQCFSPSGHSCWAGG